MTIQSPRLVLSVIALNLKPAIVSAVSKTMTIEQVRGKKLDFLESSALWMRSRLAAQAMWNEADKSEGDA